MHYRVYAILWYIGWLFGVFPLLFALMSKLCGLYVHIRGCWELAYLSLCMLLVWTVTTSLYGATETLLWASLHQQAHRHIYVAILAAFLASAITLAIVIFSRRQCLQGDEDDEEEAA